MYLREKGRALYYCWACFLTQRWQLMPLPSTPTATSLSYKSSTVVSADGSRCRYPSTTFLNHRGLAMLLTADAAAKYYNGYVSVAWTIDDWQCCWQLMPQLQHVLKCQRLCCLNQRQMAMLLTADAAAKYYNGNVSVAWIIDDWHRCWQLIPQPSYTTATSLLPEPPTIGNAADSWCRS